ncbi:MAG: transposase [archaeon]
MGLRFKIDHEEATYFITTTVVDFQPVLTQPGIPEILYDSFEFYRKKYAFGLNAYVIMPHHIHLILHLNAETSISDVMRDLKKYTSVRIHKCLEDLNSPFLERFLTKGKRAGQEFKLWMNRSDKVIMVSGKILSTKLNYIHDNPVRAGLVLRAEDYPYSSAVFYLTGTAGKVEIDEIQW